MSAGAIAGPMTRCRPGRGRAPVETIRDRTRQATSRPFYLCPVFETLSHPPCDSFVFGFFSAGSAGKQPLLLGLREFLPLIASSQASVRRSRFHFSCAAAGG